MRVGLFFAGALLRLRKSLHSLHIVPAELAHKRVLSVLFGLWCKIFLTFFLSQPKEEIAVFTATFPATMRGGGGVDLLKTRLTRYNARFFNSDCVYVRKTPDIF